MNHHRTNHHRVVRAPDRSRRGSRAGLRGRWRVLAALTAALCGVSGFLVPAAPAAAAAVPSSFTLEGKGFGHGVGMPQYGAYQMSREGGATGLSILRYYYQGVQIPVRATPRSVFVQVYGPEPYSFSGYGDTARTTTITVTGGSWRLRDAGTTTYATGTGDTTLQVTTTADGRARVTVGGKHHYGSRLRLQWSGTRHFRPSEAPAVVTVQGAHGSYRHGLLYITARKGIPNITNDLLLNTEYLYGISEMPSSWGLSGGKYALRAQAITARSYAMTKPLKDSCRCHVVDDVRDQNFTGWKKESEGTDGRYGAVWKRAVDATVRSDTEARVLTHDGVPVAAHYFSSSGGRTAHSEQVWSAYLPYERSVADPYSARAPGNGYASWTRTMTQAKASTLFGLPSVASIAVTARWTSGQMRTLTATAPDGTKKSITGKADEMRSKVGRATTVGSLPAAWISKISAVS